jgi:hypothetical protein
VERIGLIELDGLNHGEYYLAQLAVDDVPSVPFHVHKSVREKFPKEEDFMAYLARMAKAVIARCGDARNPLPQELVEGAI